MKALSLTEAQTNELRRAHRAAKNKKDADKLKFINLLRERFSAVERGLNTVSQVYQTPAVVPGLIDFIKNRQAEINDSNQSLHFKK